MQHMTRNTALLATLVLSSLTSGLQAAPPPDGRLEVPNEYPSINKAIWAAEEGDEIIVHFGTYTEDLFIDKNVTIIGVSSNGRQPYVRNLRGPHKVMSGPHQHVTASFSNLDFGKSSHRLKKSGFTADSASVEFERCDFWYLSYLSFLDGAPSDLMTRGGAVRINDGDGSFDNCSFYGNVAYEENDTFCSARGGAISILRGSLEVNNSSFIDNQASCRGYWHRLPHEVTCIASGGAIATDESTLEMMNCEFLRNIVYTTVADSDFGESNTAVYGGAVSIIGGQDHQIVKCDFEENWVTGGEMSGTASRIGGGLYCQSYDKGRVLLDSCTFEANLADAGGALCSLDHEIVAKNTYFICNTSDHLLVTNFSETGCRWWDCQEEQEEGPCLYDLNGDGVVDRDDYNQARGARRRNQHDGPEDVNGDGRVDQADLDLIQDNYGECH